MERIKKKVSAFTVIEIILIIILALIMITMLVLNFVFKDKNSAASFFGYSFYNTKSVEMMKDIPPNTLIIAKASEKENIAEGSVVLCQIGTSTVLIRVNDIQEEEGKTYYIVRFDYAAENESVRITPDMIVAKAIWQVDGFGKVINFASSTHGIIISVVIPLLLIIAIQVVRIISIRRLENEASAIDDIDDLINTRDDEQPAPVTFTEPRFIEDVTGKIPVPDTEEKSHENNKAEKGSPLYTYDNIIKEKEPALVGARRSESSGVTGAGHTGSAVKDSADDFFEKYSPRSKTATHSGNNGPVVFTPHLDNIIPDNTPAVRSGDAGEPSGANATAPVYPEKKYVAEEQLSFDNTAVSAAPENISAAPGVPEPAEKSPVPAETPAVQQKVPSAPKKKRSSAALEELMGMIDAEESKLKK